MRLTVSTATCALVASLLAAAPAQAYRYMETCTTGDGASWNNQEPISWHLSTSYVSNDLTETEVRSAVLGAFAEWDTPFCAHVPSQQGTGIDADPFDEAVDEVVIGFYETEWPAELGTGLLALTRISVVDVDCEIVGSDIAFNGTDITWVTGETDVFGEADLQAVMTHEVGHLLGIDHTEVGGSTMNYPYGGGASDWRTLGCDDTAAVCDLYVSGDASCTDSAYCPCGNPCVDGFCEGPTFEDLVDECWELFLPDLELLETEPNDDSTALTPIETTGADLVISGSSTSCGNDGQQATGDQDWFDINVPCTGRAYITLEPQALDADVDMYTFAGDLPTGEALNRLPGEPEAISVEIEEDFQLLVYCWEGAATNWTLTVHYLAPGELPGEVVEPGPTCGCESSIAGGTGAVLFVGLVPLVVIRRRRRER